MATACRPRLDNRRSRSGFRLALEASRRDPLPVFRGPAALIPLAPILRLGACPAVPRLPVPMRVRPARPAVRRRWMELAGGAPGPAAAGPGAAPRPSAAPLAPGGPPPGPRPPLPAACCQLTMMGRCVWLLMNRRAEKLPAPFASTTSAVPCGASACPTYEKVNGYELNDAANMPSVSRTKSCFTVATRAFRAASNCACGGGVAAAPARPAAAGGAGGGTGTGS